MSQLSTVTPVRIVIADDHSLVRTGVHRVLACEADLQVVGEAASAAGAVDAVRRLDPDILLLDLAMPGVSGMSALEQLAGGTTTRVILLTADINRADIVRALRLGARGVVLKDAGADLLVKSIRAVMNGEYWVGRKTVADLIEQLTLTDGTGPEAAADTSVKLTQRERDVVRALVAGYSNREIARRFSVSEDTVKHHLTNIFDKTGTSTRLELAVFAIHHRLIDE